MEMTVDAQRVLVTGATGFIGRSLCASLVEGHHVVRGLVRQRANIPGIDLVQIDDFTTLSATDPAFEHIDTVIHLAGHAHAARMTTAEAEATFSADLAMTRSLARTSSTAGVRRFIFVSTAKVLGEMTPAGARFTNDSIPAPVESYARYRLAAEDAVIQEAEARGMDWVIVRPVLVYGKGVKGNLRSLASAIWHGRPLPLGGIANRRALLALPDLIALLSICITAPSVCSKRLLAAGDGELSTSEICEALALGLQCPTHLFALPPWGWRLLGQVPMISGRVDRLTGSFSVDASQTRKLASWQPRVSSRDGLVAVGESLRKEWMRNA